MSFSARESGAAAGLAALCLVAVSCGYHVAGKADLVPRTVHSIAIPAFGNATVRYKLTDLLPEALSREFIARTRYQVVPDPDQADAVLRGAITRFIAYPTVFDQATGRASGLQAYVSLQIIFTERATGKVLFTRPAFEAKQVYQISTAGTSAVSAQAYFDESETALQRLSRDVARDVVSAILENF